MGRPPYSTSVAIPISSENPENYKFEKAKLCEPNKTTSTSMSKSNLSDSTENRTNNLATPPAVSVETLLDALQERSNQDTISRGELFNIFKKLCTNSATPDSTKPDNDGAVSVKYLITSLQKLQSKQNTISLDELINIFNDLYKQKEKAFNKVNIILTNSRLYSPSEENQKEKRDRIVSALKPINNIFPEPKPIKITCYKALFDSIIIKDVPQLQKQVDANKKEVVYCAIFPISGKNWNHFFYIGQTERTVDDRWNGNVKSHINGAKKFYKGGKAQLVDIVFAICENPYVFNVMDKKGVNGFKVLFMDVLVQLIGNRTLMKDSEPYKKEVQFRSTLSALQVIANHIDQVDSLELYELYLVHLTTKAHPHLSLNVARKIAFEGDFCWHKYFSLDKEHSIRLVFDEIEAIQKQEQGLEFPGIDDKEMQVVIDNLSAKIKKLTDDANRATEFKCTQFKSALLFLLKQYTPKNAKAQAFIQDLQMIYNHIDQVDSLELYELYLVHFKNSKSSNEKRRISFGRKWPDCLSLDEKYSIRLVFDKIEEMQTQGLEFAGIDDKDMQIDLYDAYLSAAIKKLAPTGQRGQENQVQQPRGNFPAFFLTGREGQYSTKLATESASNQVATGKRSLDALQGFRASSEKIEAQDVDQDNDGKGGANQLNRGNLSAFLTGTDSNRGGQEYVLPCGYSTKLENSDNTTSSNLATNQDVLPPALSTGSNEQKVKIKKNKKKSIKKNKKDAS